MPDWHSLYFYRNFHNHDKSWHERKNSRCLQNIFYWIQSGFTHNLTIGALIDGYMELGSKKWVSCGCRIFHEIIICIKKTVLFQKSRLFFKSWMWAFLFLILTHRGKKLISPKLVRLRISQVPSGDPKENFLVYALINGSIFNYLYLFYSGSFE